MTPFTQPPEYARIKQVHSFHELVTTPFADGVNALCWGRTLPGDFGEIVDHLVTSEGITTIDEELLNSMSVSEAGKGAIGILVDDLRLLRDHGLLPSLDLIRGYPRDEHPAVVRTDVYSFHADSATERADTYLCTYHGPASEGVRNEEAQRRVDIPATRAELLKLYGGADDSGFAEFLNEHCYDLHYAPLPSARPFSFGLGNLWRIAIEYPGSPVPPCIHRAPETVPGQPPRLLLIS
jgi:hypothetical protein